MENANIEIARSWKIKGRDEEMERTNIDHIYAIGDILDGNPELQTTAAKSSKLLAHRIHHRVNNTLSEQEILAKYSMDLKYVPTTVFSPTEYSFVGLTEEEAAKEFGEENLEIYHREVTPLQYAIVKDNLKAAYMKVICLKTDDERVIGMHYFGPAAEEVISGYALSMKLGLKKADLDNAVGVHPSVSEDLHMLEITKRSGEDYRKTGC